MPLHLIKGPLNSGRTGKIRTLVGERVRSEPVIVAPTGDARYGLEAELCQERGAALGPLVTGFLDLAEMVVLAAGLSTPPLASASQRRQLLARATAATELRILAASASRPGFTAALERLFGELRAAGVRPPFDGYTDRYLEEMLAIYSAYLNLLDRTGLSDQAGLIDSAATALGANPDCWGARPVFMHGFDDFSPDQLRLVRALSAATEVTISLTYEDRQSLRARSRLLGQLEEAGGTVIESMPPVPGFTPNRLLYHLERHFGEATPPPPPTGHEGLTIMSCAGERGEAEVIAAEIKPLISSGTPAARIAVALRTPNRQGPELARVLRAAGVPVALETEITITATATGQALADLTAAAFGGDAAALVRLARGVGLEIDPDQADVLEWTVRRRRLAGTDEVLAAHHGDLAEIEEVRQVASSGPERLARWLMGFVERAAKRAGGNLEARAARLIATTAEELAPMAADSAELLRALVEIELRTWSGPIGERVRIASPYTLRTTRFDHLFVCSLQEGEFPRRGGEGPFLSEDQRARLGLPERADTEAEEMYLFHVCLSLPELGLWLSSRTTDADGRPEQPSPFLAQIEALAGTAIQRLSFGLDQPAPPPERATSSDELARALALAGHPAASEFVADTAVATEIENRIQRAERHRELAARPRPLRHRAVLDDLGGRERFGATGLEAFLRYPYHWFIGRELMPEPLDRDDQHMVDGSLVHAVLHDLYSQPPGASRRPDPAGLSTWLERAGALLEEKAGRVGLSRHFVADRIRLRRMSGYLRNFIEQEATEAETAVHPAIFEASFGGDGDERGPLLGPGWSLRGTIDRVDLTADGGQGLLQDYKYSAGAIGLPKFESEGVLQIPLYMAALARIWGVKPLGGLYRPLRGKRGEAGRGMLSREALNGPLAGLAHSRSDLVDEAEMTLLIDEALAQATAVVTDLRAGRIDREPLPEAIKKATPAWAAIDRRIGGLGETENEVAAP